jgi:hypothetical protein
MGKSKNWNLSTGDFLRALGSSPWTHRKEQIHKWTNQRNIHYPVHTLISLSSDQLVSPQGCLQWHNAKHEYSYNHAMSIIAFLKRSTQIKQFTQQRLLQNRVNLQTGLPQSTSKESTCLEWHTSRGGILALLPTPSTPPKKPKWQYFITVATNF